MIYVGWRAWFQTFNDPETALLQKFSDRRFGSVGFVSALVSQEIVAADAERLRALESVCHATDGKPLCSLDVHF